MNTIKLSLASDFFPSRYSEEEEQESEQEDENENVNGNENENEDKESSSEYESSLDASLTSSERSRQWLQKTNNLVYVLANLASAIVAQPLTRLEPLMADWEDVALDDLG
jgi:hypothetical protein